MTLHYKPRDINARRGSARDEGMSKSGLAIKARSPTLSRGDHRGCVAHPADGGNPTGLTLGIRDPAKSRERKSSEVDILMAKMSWRSVNPPYTSSGGYALAQTLEERSLSSLPSRVSLPSEAQKHNALMLV